MLENKNHQNQEVRVNMADFKVRSVVISGCGSQLVSIEIDIEAQDCIDALDDEKFLDALGKERCMEYFNLIEKE